MLYVSPGNYGSWLESKASRLETEQSSEASVAKQLRKELHWLRGGSGATKARKKAVRELRDDSKARSSKLSALKRGGITIPQVCFMGCVCYPEVLCTRMSSPNVLACAAALYCVTLLHHIRHFKYTATCRGPGWEDLSWL